ncbi:hypothetical protein BCS89_04100 [Vibrio splendidus]|nr:hypothetical protein BCS97_16525 [Vibrio splendidus]PMP20173.1 hypothetical protein BCS89_04100 [Vibrio splendidus]PMP36814.1 hypothetical protein BCS88_05365 [Vibrio splendidus]PMP41739.1 hypothetical protein BCS87_05775 [Vibrio splendidus]PMP45754.1 hypothetical protein BCS85_16960 [Vibrio splendidus]
MRAGREEKQMRVNEIRDAKRLKSRYKELDEGNGMRDTKSKNKEGDSLVFRSSLLVYPHPASAFKLFATRFPASRICL